MRWLVCILFFVSCLTSLAQSNLSVLESKMQQAGLVNVSLLDPTIVVDLQYATANNMTNVVLYDTLRYAYLHPIASDKILVASKIVKKQYPNYRLIIFDAARPLSVQRKMYAAVQGTRMALYVAHPDRRGLHNFGLAVDVSIVDHRGLELDMGTPFDFLGPAAGINKEEELIERKILTRAQVDNRMILRDVMIQAGFIPIRGEWWHFNAVSLTEAVAKYKVID